VPNNSLYTSFCILSSNYPFNHFIYLFFYKLCLPCLPSKLHPNAPHNFRSIVLWAAWQGRLAVDDSS